MSIVKVTGSGNHLQKIHHRREICTVGARLIQMRPICCRKGKKKPWCNLTKIHHSIKQEYLESAYFHQGPPFIVLLVRAMKKNNPLKILIFQVAI